MGDQQGFPPSHSQDPVRHGTREEIPVLGPVGWGACQPRLQEGGILPRSEVSEAWERAESGQGRPASPLL